MGNQGFTIKGNAYQVGAEIYIPNHAIGTPPVSDPNLYWEQVNHNAQGRHYILREHKTGKREGYRTDAEYETLRKQYSEAMIKAEILSDEVKLNHTLAKQHHEEYNHLQKEHQNLTAKYDELRKTNVDEECTVKESGINPDWVEADNLHKERMRLENDSILWGNRKIEAELNGYRDYPKSLWYQMDLKVDKLKGRFIYFYGAAVALIINEVIQWVTR